MEAEVKESGSVRNFLASWTQLAKGDVGAGFGKMQLCIIHDVTSQVGKLDAYIASLNKPQAVTLRKAYNRLLRGLYAHARKGKSQRKHWRANKPLLMRETYAPVTTYPVASPETVIVPTTGMLEMNYTFSVGDQFATREPH